MRRTFYAGDDAYLYTDLNFDSKTAERITPREKLLIDEIIFSKANKIAYKIDNKYVKTNSVAKKLDDFIVARIVGVDYFPTEKYEYESNPRIKTMAIYLTTYSASNEETIDEMIKLAKETNINAFVIDVKDDEGHMLFSTATYEKKYI